MLQVARPINTKRRSFAGDIRGLPELAYGRGVVLGAIGRALAAIGALDEANAVLPHAVTHWRSINKIHESSSALCERFRLLGLLQVP